MDEVRQVVVHPVVWPHLEAWLHARNIRLALFSDNEDDLPTYMMTIDEIGDPKMTQLTCNWAYLGHVHGPHAWEPQPGMDAVWCEGTVEPSRERS